MRQTRGNLPAAGRAELWRQLEEAIGRERQRFATTEALFASINSVVLIATKAP